MDEKKNNSAKNLSGAAQAGVAATVPEWVGRGVGIVARVAAKDGEKKRKVAQPDAVLFGRLVQKGFENWTEAEGWEALRRLEPYDFLMKQVGVRWVAVRGAEPVARGNLSRRGTLRAGKMLFAFRTTDVDARVAVREVDGMSLTTTADMVRGWEIFGMIYRPSMVGAVEHLERVYGFTLDEQAEAAMEQAREESRELSRLSRSVEGERLEVEGFAGEMWPYQQVGVAYLTATKRAILGDEMGLGKTLEALATVQALGAWPCVVTTVAICKLGWRDEAQRWLPGVRVVIWDGTTPGEGVLGAEEIVEGERVLHVVNHDLLHARFEELKAVGMRAFILDEIHKLTNRKAKRSQAAQKLAARVPVRLGLTGTPLQNGKPIEVWALINLLGRGKDFGGFWNFTKRYCEAKQAQHGWDMSGARHLPELHDKLRACCYLRRKKSQVCGDMPKKLVTRVPLGMSVDGAMRYAAAAKDVKAWLAEKSACDGAWERTVAHLSVEEREFQRGERLAAALERLDGMELLLRLGTLRKEVAMGKLPLVVEWCREMCASRKLVVFAHHKPAVQGLAKALVGEMGVRVIAGDTSQAARRRAVEDFQKEEGVRLMVVNMMAGGTGLDGLQRACSDVAYFEYPWTPSVMSQASARVDRTGQTGAVQEWHLLAPGTVDDELLAILEEKAAGCDAVTDGESVEARKSLAKSVAGRVARGVFCGGGNGQSSATEGEARGT